MIYDIQSEIEFLNKLGEPHRQTERIWKAVINALGPKILEEFKKKTLMRPLKEPLVYYENAFE